MTTPPAGPADYLSVRDLLLVAVGGGCGVLARYGVGLALPRSNGAFPVATLLVNLTGSLLVAVLAAYLDRAEDRRWVRPLLITGVFGSFTTYSTFAVETSALLAARPITGIVYVAATVLGGLAVAGGGGRLVRR